MKNFRKFKEMPYITKLGIISGSSLMFGLMLGYVLFPVILKHQIKKEMSLRNKTDMKEMWVKFPFPFIFRVWVWNITNPVEATMGQKPILREIGPYVYEKWMEKTDLIENKVEDSIEYSMKQHFVFRQDLSGNLTGDEMIYHPDLVLIATAAYIANYKPGAAKIAMKGLNVIFNNPKTIFSYTVVRELLFGTVVINCTSSDPYSEGVCDEYKTVPDNIIKQSAPNIFTYNSLGFYNKTSEKRFKVYRGIKKIQDVGAMITYNGYSEQTTWPGKECNILNGTDSTIFRPFLTKEDTIWMYSHDICRSIPMFYEKSDVYRGIFGLKYVYHFDNLDVPEKRCFCSDVGCPPPGFFDEWRCLYAAVLLSSPHMYATDVGASSSVIGQYPEKDKHETYILMEPISGSPLIVKKRIQVNSQVVNFPAMDLFKDVPNSYIPLLWFEDSLELNKTYINMLNYQLFYPTIAVNTIKWLTIIGGFVGGLYAYYLHRFKNNGDQILKIFRDSPQLQESNSNNVQNEDTQETRSNNGITPLERDNDVYSTQPRF